MTYTRGHIPVVWNMDEVANLEYFSEPFNDSNTVKNWQKLYGRNFRIGEQADYRSRQPQCQEQIMQALSQQGIFLDRVAFSWYRMQPGDIIPEHSDTYISYSKYHHVNPSCVVRVLVLLEDWRPGHLLEVAGNAITAYTAGTWVMWRAHTPHMAGNIGQYPRYTLQITGVLNDKTGS